MPLFCCVFYRLDFYKENSSFSLIFTVAIPYNKEVIRLFLQELAVLV